ncbi:hypothetical protein B296_00046403 [Ensete ventricosum]|uniref:Uncharacterized protein n=1 Tax=Ensete ventricosum TaxID=4639 RepID=A0A426X573_ENSVE|nr:hypothetical protein B296_00046403 [Ensete ventricosum]
MPWCIERYLCTVPTKSRYASTDRSTLGSRIANTGKLCSWSYRVERRKGHRRRSGHRGVATERTQSRKRGACNNVPSKAKDGTVESYFGGCNRSGGEVSRQRKGEDVSSIMLKIQMRSPMAMAEFCRSQAGSHDGEGKKRLEIEGADDCRFSVDLQKGEVGIVIER